MTHRRIKILLAAGYGATLLGTAAFGYFAWTEYRSLVEERAEVQKQIQVADVKIRRIPDLETDVICLRENVDELVKILPNGREVNEFVNKLNDFALESGVRILSLKPEKDRGRRKKDVFDKVLYRLEIVANLDRFLRFLSLCEGWERFVRVTSLDVHAGEWKEGEPREDVVHDIQVVLETYAYQGHDDPSKVATTIHNYERRKEALRDEIVARRSEIRVERYEYVPNPLRRDPFVDPRVRVSDAEGGLPFAEQQAIVGRLVEDAGALSELIETSRDEGLNFIRRLELEAEIDRRAEELDSRIASVLSERKVTDPTLKRRIEREVLPVVQGLRQREGLAAAAATVDELRRYGRDVALLLDEGRWEQVVERVDLITGRVEADTLGPEGVALLQMLEKARFQAQTAMDFERRDIRIGGAIVAGDGGRSVVVVNGKVLTEGEPLEEGLLVRRIAQDHVEFEYRGVRLTKAR